MALASSSIQPAAGARRQAAIAPKVMLVLIAPFALVAPQAAAIPLPASVVDGTAQFSSFDPGVRIQTFGLLDHQFSGLGTLQFFSSGEPALRASADIGPAVDRLGSGTSSGFVRYSFEIVGPDCAGSEGCVPVDITAAGQVAGAAGGGGGFESIARWSLRNTSEITLLGDSVSVFTGVGGGATDDDAFVADHNILLHTNREYRVVMEVLARASTGVIGVGGFGSATAFVDPVFSFAAGVDPALYSFRFSEGISNTLPPSPVSEPGTAALLALGGLVLLGSRRVRRAPC